MAENATITPKEFAVMVDADPKAVRRFLRSLTTEHPGKGRRWAITPETVDALKARYAEYSNRKGRTLTIDDLADAPADDEA